MNAARRAALALVAVALASGLAHGATRTSPRPTEDRVVKLVRSEAEWKQRLTPEQFRVLRQEGTERAFTGAYWNQHAHGVYVCAGCGLTLFRSDEKFDSGTGWPSFTRPVEANNVETETDRKFMMTRTEVHCARCDTHLGHVFPDGPRDAGGMRYCINSASLNFEPKKGSE